MKPGAGKRKGSNFEGQVAKKLSDGLSPLKFIRTQSSGARVGGKNFETLGKMFGDDALKLFVGDVVAVNEKESGVVFKYSIECKSYKSPDNFPALVSGNSNVFKWMNEAVDDAKKVNREPLLVFKWNNTPIFTARTNHQQFPFRLTLSQAGNTLYISYLDELLKFQEFWYDIIEKENK
jgi:hypothetical protein